MNVYIAVDQKEYRRDAVKLLQQRGLAYEGFYNQQGTLQEGLCINKIQIIFPTTLKKYSLVKVGLVSASYLLINFIYISFRI